MMGIIIFPTHSSFFPKQRPIYIACSNGGNLRHGKKLQKTRKEKPYQQQPIALSGYDEELWDGTFSVSPDTSLSSVEDIGDIETKNQHQPIKEEEPPNEKNRPSK